MSYDSVSNCDKTICFEQCRIVVNEKYRVKNKDVKIKSRLVALNAYL